MSNLFWPYFFYFNMSIKLGVTFFSSYRLILTSYLNYAKCIKFQYLNVLGNLIVSLVNTGKCLIYKTLKLFMIRLRLMMVQNLDKQMDGEVVSGKNK